MAFSTQNQQAIYDQVQRISSCCAQELAYEKSLRQSEALFAEESARRLRAQILLLEDDNDNLHEQLIKDEERIDELTGVGEDLNSQLIRARNSLDSSHSDLRLKSREIETLKVELGSLHDVTMDSTKLLTEKLALAREVTSLKPEIDHLRSQVVAHQAVLAEKLTLQRQLSSLQVELELEKRATQRAIAKEGKLQIEDAKTAAQLESLQAEMTKERKERLKIERDAQKVSADWEARRVILESRLDSLKTQLKAAKEQFRNCQNELQSARAAPRPVAGRSTSNITSDEVTRDPRKRVASCMIDDTIIGTPGDLRATKKTNRSSTVPGDKSTFSITPFLNRTASVAPDNPVEEYENNRTDEDNETLDRVLVVTKDCHGLSPTAPGPERNLKDGKNHQAAQKGSSLKTLKSGNTQLKVSQAGRSRKAPTLDQVVEEDNNESVAPKIPHPEHNAVEDTNLAEGTTEPFEIKKKKRKLLGGGFAKTLFDDDDDGRAIKGDKSGARTFGTLGRRFMLLLQATRPTHGSIRIRATQLIWTTCMLSVDTYAATALDPLGQRYASSSSNRWKSRQGKDKYVITAKVQNLKSRAAFKLLEINDRYKIFQKGQTVVDLGYAPGSWSQVAVDRTAPNGRVIGIDIIPAQPPKGVSTIQGNFLSPAVQEEVKKFVRETDRGRLRFQHSLSSAPDEESFAEEDLVQSSTSYVGLEKSADLPPTTQAIADVQSPRCNRLERDTTLGRTVDIVLSDLLEPWEQTNGFWKRSLSDPYYRMMNTSGINMRDHTGSMVSPRMVPHDANSWD
ncbi:MAG: hypothetical protein Q9195_002788 [Heterodermia aff. obscurata]